MSSVQSNNKDKLNKEEIEILNSLLVSSQDKFNFENKNIAFITGSSGSKVLSKNEFFETCINPWVEEGKKPQIFMVQLSEEEKNQSGGYDVFVLSWVKVFTKNRKRKMIEILGNSPS